MESLNSVNMNVREKELAASFSDLFRRVWIGYSRFGSVVITTFPIGASSGYNMYFAKNVQDFSLDNLRKIVLSQVRK